MAEVTITPVDEVPPATRKGGRRTSKWDAVVETMAAQPGQWFIVLKDPSRPKAQGAQRYLTTAYEAKVEAKTRKDDGSDEVVLYARVVS